MDVTEAIAVKTDTTTDTSAEADALETGNATGEDGGKDERVYKASEVKAMLADHKEREKRKYEATKAAAEEAARQKALVEQGEFQKLAEERQAVINKLEPYKGQAERYEAALTRHLEAQRKDLPAHIIALLDKLDVADQLEYIAANRDVLVPPAQRNGPPGTPPPANGQAQIDEVRRAGLEYSKAQMKRAF